MKMINTVLNRFLIFSVLMVSVSASAKESEFDKLGFWMGIEKNNSQVPSGYQAVDLALALQKHLGDSNPIWRDQLAYSITAAWIQSGNLNESDIKKLMPVWINAAENMHHSDVLARSFGVLSLDLVAVFDQRKPFLKKHEIDQLWRIAVFGIMQPQDWRGWDEKIGWVHITAHSADLIKTLSSHPEISLQQQHDFFDAIESSLNTAPRVFVFAEMERLSDAVIALQQRKDFSGPAWTSLLKRLNSLDQGFEGVNPKPLQYIVKRNANQFLAFVSWKENKK